MSTKVWQKNLSSPWFELIRDRVKIAEGRPNKGDFKEMNIGDIIEFTQKDKESYKVEITAKKEYTTFKQMLKTEGLECVLPGVKTIADGVNVYRQWYDAKTEKEYGVVAIHIKTNQVTFQIRTPF
jgi:ASC-1-like (ASCH) protein